MGREEPKGEEVAAGQAAERPGAMTSRRFALVPAVHLLLVRDGKLLMSRRFGTGFHDGELSLVAGHLDGDEPLAVAMAREAREEAGIVIEPAQLELVLTVHRRADEGSLSNERIDFYFEASAFRGEPHVNEPEKCSEMGFFTFDPTPSETIPYIADAIRLYRRGIRFGTWGWTESSVASAIEPI